MKLTNIRHYKGYHIKVYKQKADTEYLAWHSLSDDEQDIVDFPYNSYGSRAYAIYDLLGQMLDSDFKCMSDDSCCFENAENEINFIIKDNKARVKI